MLTTYPKFWSVIGTTIFAILIFGWYAYFARLIWWAHKIDKWDTEPLHAPTHYRRLEIKRANLVNLYTSWIRSANLAYFFQFIATGGISALIFALIKDALQQTGSWRKLLTIEYLPLFVYVGATLVGCIFFFGCYFLMHRRFKKTIERLNCEVREEISRTQGPLY
jgi:hypothetical protein